MRIVINQLVTLGVKTGIGHYTEQLLRGLRTQARGDQIDGFPTGWVGRACRVSVRLLPSLGKVPRGTGRMFAVPTITGFRNQVRAAGVRLLGRYFQTVCSRHGYDLYHEPNFIPLPTDRPTVVTIHDLSVLRFPQWHPAERVAFYEKHFAAAVGRCAHFLTASDFVRQEVLRTLHVPPHRVTRVYNGVRPEFQPLAQPEVEGAVRRLGLRPGYLLYVGTIEPRKNLLMLMRAYCRLPAALRDRRPLVLAGGWGWNAGEVAEYLQQTGRHCGVLHLGYVADRDLPALYNGARALVYPSHYEGFGLPPLEMMACGGAVLVSTAAALVETTGGRAHLIHPGDEAGWHDALARVAVDDDWEAALRDGVTEAARRFTWERCAAATLRVYRSLQDRQLARAG